MLWWYFSYFFSLFHFPKSILFAYVFVVKWILSFEIFWKKFQEHANIITWKKSIHPLSSLYLRNNHFALYISKNITQKNSFNPNWNKHQFWEWILICITDFCSHFYLKFNVSTWTLSHFPFESWTLQFSLLNKNHTKTQFFLM